MISDDIHKALHIIFNSDSIKSEIIRIDKNKWSVKVPPINKFKFHYTFIFKGGKLNNTFDRFSYSTRIERTCDVLTICNRMTQRVIPFEHMMGIARELHDTSTGGMMKVLFYNHKKYMREYNLNKLID